MRKHLCKSCSLLITDSNHLYIQNVVSLSLLILFSCPSFTYLKDIPKKVDWTELNTTNQGFGWVKKVCDFKCTMPNVGTQANVICQTTRFINMGLTVQWHTLKAPAQSWLALGSSRGSQSRPTCLWTSLWRALVESFEQICISKSLMSFSPLFPWKHLKMRIFLDVSCHVN